jgi:lipoate-protein ligase A
VVTLAFHEESRLDGETNMRRDRELLADAEHGRSGCRVYSWDGPWITLGRYQSPEKDLCDPAAIPWVIRPTGGKAVLHGHDVTVGMAIALDQLDLDRISLKTVYRAIIGPLVDSLRACGVPARLAEETRFSGSGVRTADCFAFSSPNDVVDEATGLKVCGCALRLTETAVLLQASLPCGPPLVKPESVIRNAALTYRQWDPQNFAPALKESLAALVDKPNRIGLGVR